jgi:uncharacterized protein
MAERFFDTSAIAKHYRAEVGTPEVDAFLAETASHHFISSLAVVELHSVFARLVRQGAITPAEFHLARGLFLNDIASGVWQVVPIIAAHFHRAQQPLVRYGLAQNLRSLDAIQLSAALLNPIGSLDAFVSADANLNAVAAAEGLPPNPTARRLLRRGSHPNEDTTMSSSPPEDAENTKRERRQRSISMIVGLFVLMLGVPPLLNALGNPRIQTLHTPDIMRLIASGWCFGLGSGLLLSTLMFRRV